MTHTYRRSMRVASTIVAVIGLGALPARAQQPDADIRSELAALKAEVQQLRAEVAALKTGADLQAATPASAADDTATSSCSRPRLPSSRR